MPAMSCCAPSRHLLSCPAIVQFALKTDEYSNTVEDSSGDKYNPGEDEIVKTETDEEISLLPLGVRHNHVKECVGRPTHALLSFPLSPTGVEAQDVDKGEDRNT